MKISTNPPANTRKIPVIGRSPAITVGLLIRLANRKP
jgi:hypothetical protein